MEFQDHINLVGFITVRYFISVCRMKLNRKEQETELETNAFVTLSTDPKNFSPASVLPLTFNRHTKTGHVVFTGGT